MRTFASMIIPVIAIGILSGCARKEPVTILFTGDDQGRLVPSG